MGIDGKMTVIVGGGVVVVVWTGLLLILWEEGCCGGRDGVVGDEIGCC